MRLLVRARPRVRGGVVKGRLRAREGVRIPGVGRLLHAYWRFSRGLTLGVRTVVIDGRERVFLVRHTYAHGWHFPGGGVEPGEAALDAARRELREEAQIDIVGEPRLHGVFFNKGASRRRSEERRVGKECRSRWSPYH